MKISVRDALYMYDSINNIAKNENICNASVKIKFLLSRNVRVLQPIWEEFQASRQQLLIEHSSPADEEGTRSVTQEQADFINSEIDKLQNMEVELPLTPISLPALEELNLGLVEMNGLYPIIKQEEV